MIIIFAMAALGHHTYRTPLVAASVHQMCKWLSPLFTQDQLHGTELD